MAKKKKSMHRWKFWIVAIIIFILLFSVIWVAIIYIAPNWGNTTQPAFEEVAPQQEILPEPSVDVEAWEGTWDSALLTGDTDSQVEVEVETDQANEQDPLAEPETEGGWESEGGWEIGIEEVDVSGWWEGDIEVNMLE